MGMLQAGQHVTDRAACYRQDSMLEAGQHGVSDFERELLSSCPSVEP